MTCDVCRDGLIPFVASDNPKADTAIAASDLLFAVCQCRAGKLLRATKNNSHTVAPLWVAWCAREAVDTSRVFMAEDVFDGYTHTAGDAIGRAAALLAAGQKRRGDRPHK